MTESPKLEPAKYFFFKIAKISLRNNSWPKVNSTKQLMLDLNEILIVVVQS